MNKLSIIRFYATLTVIISVVLLSAMQDVFMIANLHFYLLVILLFMDIYTERSVSLMMVWLAGFIYIVLSDMLLNSYMPENLWAAKFMLLSNDMLLLGYYNKRPEKKNASFKMAINEIKPSKIFWVTYFFLYILFLSYSIPITINSIVLGGRNAEDHETNLLLSTLLNGYKVMPVLIAAYFAWFKPKKRWIAVVLSLPFLLAEFFSGTRFRFLFSILPFLLVIGFLDLRKLSSRSILKIIIIVVAIASLSSIMMRTRNSGYSNSENVVAESGMLGHPYSNYLSTKISAECSPEGTVPMMTILKRHTEVDGYSYGVYTSFIFYFWIPRTIWPNKPEMIGYSLAQRYLSGIGAGHSSSFGFTGELFADFGYFSLIIFLFLGVLMKKGNNFVSQYDFGRVPCLQSLIAVLLIPYIFFSVRSPITATTYTLMQILIVYLLYKLFFASKKLKKIISYV